MKVVMLIFRFVPACTGGAELATCNIARELTKMGVEVHVVTSADPGLPSTSIIDGFHVHRVRMARDIPLVSSASFMTKAIGVIGRIEPDIVHTQGLSLGWIGFIASRLYGTPHVSYGRGSDVHTDYRFKRLVLGLSIRSSDAVIALTDEMEKKIKEISDRPVIIIPNGIELERFDSSSREDLGKLGIAPGSTVFTFVGTLRAVKGVRYLLDAFVMVHREHPGTELLIVGGGPEREALEMQATQLGIDEHVHFAGPQTNDRVPGYFLASDVFVLPSLSEGFPLVILEAMAAGLPIVGTRVGGLPSLVTDGVNGLLVEPGSAEQLAEKMGALMNDLGARRAMCERNLEKVQGYSWNRTAQMLFQIYESLMTDRGEIAPGSLTSSNST